MTEAVQQNPDQRNSTDSPAENVEKDVATLAKEYGARLRHAVGYFEGVESRRQKTYRFKADDYAQTMHYGYGEIKLKFKSVKKSVSPLAEMTLLWNGLERTMEVEVEYDREFPFLKERSKYRKERPRDISLRIPRRVASAEMRWNLQIPLTSLSQRSSLRSGEVHRRRWSRQEEEGRHST